MSLVTSGCASQPAGHTNATSSLGKAVGVLTVSFKPTIDRGPAWEDAVIAQAIAAHEMRNP